MNGDAFSSIDETATTLGQALEGATSEQAKATVQSQLKSGNISAVFGVLPALVRRFPEEKSFQQLYQQIEHQAHTRAAQARFPGQSYLEWLQWFHRAVQPKTYMEIGVESGASLRFSSGNTLSIGVDPEPRIVHQQDSWVKVFAMPSDDFFFTQDVKKHFNNQPIDFSFIDGLHTFDQALKDFINIEQNAHETTIALFHDIYPVVPSTAARQRRTRFWLGDTWKVVPVLKALRPDLTVFTIPTYPSGLTVVAGLDSTSNVLKEAFAPTVSQWMPIAVEDYMENMASTLNVVENSEDSVLDQLSEVLNKP